MMHYPKIHDSCISYSKMLKLRRESYTFWRTIFCWINNLLFLHANTRLSATLHRVQWCFMDWLITLLVFTYWIAVFHCLPTLHFQVRINWKWNLDSSCPEAFYINPSYKFIKIYKKASESQCLFLLKLYAGGL